MSTKQPDETQTRWYMVNKDGMATLCKDHADAKQEAADAQAVWRHLGPHRAVQLVEAPLMGAAGDAEFMRQVVAVAVTMLFDGYKEDVMRVFSTGELIEIVRITAPLRPQQVEDIYKRAWDALSTPSSAMGAAGDAGWVTLPGTLPETGKPVLLDIGKKYPIRATYYCPEGWREWSQHELTYWTISETPVAWCELPTPPPSAKGVAL